jgi:hypothetical protein
MELSVRAKPIRTFWPLVTLRVATPVAILAYFGYKASLVSAAANVGWPSLSSLAIVTCCLFLSYILGGMRWSAILQRPGAISERSLIALYWIGGLFSHLLPSPLSDMGRIWAATHKGLPLRDAARSTIVERVTMLLSLLVLVAASSPLLAWRTSQSFPLVLAAGIVCAFLALYIFWKRIILRVRKWPGNWQDLLIDYRSNVRNVFRSRYGLKILVTSLLSHTTIIISAYILGRLTGLPILWFDYIAIIPIATLAMVVPLSVGGWGLREGALIGLLGTLGVEPAMAFTYSVSLGLCLSASSLPGVIFLAKILHGRARAHS